jgi:hypothetical protein
MNATVDRKEYSSPWHKLARFFEKSRDGWKRKYQEAKTVAKRLVNQIAKLKESRDRWKALARQYRAEVRQLQRQLAETKNSLP